MGGQRIGEGERFGRLVTRRFVPGTRQRPGHWECVCDCGSTVPVPGSKLRSGNTKSCGCWRRDLGAQFHRSHGLTDTAEHRVWRAMLTRCRNPNQRTWHRYGGRGIAVCKRWERFENFLADMGPRPGPGYSLDRIRQNRGYSPRNCRWATQREQMRNMSRNRVVECRGERLTLAGWADRTGIKADTIRGRLERGVPPALALELDG